MGWLGTRATLQWPRSWIGLGLGVLGWLGLTSCGGPRHAEAPPAPTTKEQAQPEGESVVHDASRGAFAYIDPDTSVVALLDVSVLRRSRVFSLYTLVAAMEPEASAQLAQREKDCGFDPVMAATRVAFSRSESPDDEDAGTALLAFEMAKSNDEVFACVEGLLERPGEVTSVAGQQARTFQHKLLVEREGVFLLGSRRAVERVLAHPPRRARLPEGAFLYVTVSLPNPYQVESAEFQVGETDGKLSAVLSAALDSRESAKRLKKRAEQGLVRLHDGFGGAQLSETRRELFNATLDAISIEQRERRLTASMRLVDPETTTVVGGLLAGLATHGVRRYIQNAKRAEAYRNVGEIAMRLQRYASGPEQFEEGQSLEPTTVVRLPRSAPLTPPEVPAGVKTRSQPSDWQHESWAAIDFSIEEPQYFSYEFVTAPDGKSTVVRARGDLDGDGQQSSIELSVSVNLEGDVVISESFEETDVDE